jgi:hypothetical protein
MMMLTLRKEDDIGQMEFCAFAEAYCSENEREPLAPYFEALINGTSPGPIGSR